jgi:hypothetical protein
MRYNLTETGKTGKYFKYAIGEIVLVVIGILIALQINNWNQSQKEKKIEANYLKNITADLKEQLASIEVQMDYERDYYEATSRIIDFYNINNEFSLDSLFFKDTSYLTERKTFVITDPTYTDLISSGNITIIKNKENKDKLLNYYQDLERIEKVIQNNNSLLTDQHYVSTFLKHGYHYINYKESATLVIADMPGNVILPKYQTELQVISKNVLSKDVSKLEFFNAISFRQKIAIGHYAFLQNTKSITQALIDDLERSNQE